MMEMIETCEQCKIEFPMLFYAPMYVDGAYCNICPVCALALRNKLAGLPKDTPFTGKIAQGAVEDFKEWKKWKEKINEKGTNSKVD